MYFVFKLCDTSALAAFVWSCCSTWSPLASSVGLTTLWSSVNCCWWCCYWFGLNLKHLTKLLVWAAAQFRNSQFVHIKRTFTCSAFIVGITIVVVVVISIVCKELAIQRSSRWWQWYRRYLGDVWKPKERTNKQVTNDGVA